MFLAAGMAASLVACGGSSTTDGGGTSEKKTESQASDKSGDSGEKSKIRVCIAYSGNLGDKSYNDSCNEGSQ